MWIFRNCPYLTPLQHTKTRFRRNNKEEQQKMSRRLILFIVSHLSLSPFLSHLKWDLQMKNLKLSFFQSKALRHCVYPSPFRHFLILVNWQVPMAMVYLKWSMQQVRECKYLFLSSWFCHTVFYSWVRVDLFLRRLLPDDGIIWPTEENVKMQSK